MYMLAAVSKDLISGMLILLSIVME